ncbi:hypothetical protein [Novosphingobium sp. FSW06-99]|uniref:hypothetical protein n=1 Tax=Novosphingobium sp. FSW06-99 TaxID=1739113 RepID=UPI000B2DA652|nr:hypothetical protein [Novosphingobium sp. FSW06-99]
MTIETLETAAKADLAYGVGELKLATTDIKALVANRVGDVVIALIVLGSIVLGHAL